MPVMKYDVQSKIAPSVFRFDGDPTTLVAESTRMLSGKKLITTVRVIEELACNAGKPEIARVIDMMAYEAMLARVTT